MTAAQRKAVVSEARSWLGTPFLHSARIKGVGVDCAQLLIAVFAAAGVIEDFEPAPYPRDWFVHSEKERYLQELLPRATRVEHPYELGDVFAYRFGRATSHAGILVDPEMILHADGKIGIVTLSQIAMQGLQTRFAGAYRVGS